MANESISNPEIDPFFNNLEDVNVVGQSPKAPSLATEASRLGGYRSLLIPKHKPKYGFLVLAVLGFIMLGYLWIKAPSMHTELAKAATTAAEPENKVFIATRNPQGSLSLENPTHKIEINQANVGRGGYFVKIASCSFNTCIDNTVQALSASSLPHSTRVNFEVYPFIEVVSQKNYSPDKVSDILKALEPLKAQNIYASIRAEKKKMGESSRILLGLFSTLQEAKTALEAVQTLDFSSSIGSPPPFTFAKVSKRQSFTQVYAGPFADKSTALTVQRELTSLTSLQPQGIERLTFSPH